MKPRRPLDGESFEAEKEPVFGDWEDGVVMFADGSLYVKVVGFPTPFSNDSRLIGESMWVIVKKGNEYEGKGYLANKPIYSSLKVGTLIDYGYGTNIQKPMFKGSDKTDIITEKQMLDPNFKGILRTTPDEYYENEMQLFGDEDEEILKEFNEIGLLYSIDDKLWNKKMKGFDAESFEAAYTPEQRLDDYTPEQLTTSSAVTGDFFEDSLKYSYGGTQAAEEIPQEETEIVYAEGFPALQNAEAGMTVENIENYYKDKEDKFMTLVVDEATLFRLASDLPIFVKLTPSKYAGYTNLRFNYVENPDMEQKILSYAISLPSNMEQQEEPEYLAGDVRNRLFNVEFDDWAEQEMKTHGNEVSFKDWADEESESHGDDEFMDWAKHEEESHDERYEAEGGRNVSDFEMGNTDRYEIGDEIIALSSALKKIGDWDWKNVKKIGKGIKQGKYERIQKHMADIDYKTRRVLWDRHHNDFFNIFTDEQIRGLAIPWVTDKYEAEISGEKLEQMERKFHKKIDSYQEGINYTACKSCGLECKVEALEDTKGSVLYHFYSCKCGHNDIQDSSYDAESFDAVGDMEFECSSCKIRLDPHMNENEIKKFFIIGCTKCGVNSWRLAPPQMKEMLRKGELVKYFWDEDSKEWVETELPELKEESEFDAESFEAKQEVKPRKLCSNCNRQRLTPHTSAKGITVCATCQRRFGLKSKQAESFEAQHKPRKICSNCHKQKIDSSASSKGYTICATCTRRYGFDGRKSAEDNRDEEYKFISRIPKSMGIGKRTEILRNNLEYVFKKANRPLYPREVVELYNRERGTGKQANFKKGGLSTGKISRLIKSEPQKYYVSRSGLIHHVGESSIKDYIRNLPAKYYAEETNRMLISKEDILKYLQNSPEYIRKYTAPWKYTSYGIAKEFDVAPSSMRTVLRQMELKGLLKTISKSVEDAPRPVFTKLKIYYLANERLLNQ